ncbi:DNA-binding XRE family transcriptional regulator [Aquimarina sp. MAR_2010_214]|uniref:helix-turn-helix domain-containing protein n=1 Tax=Aquimarina sp. MAR_2010_214 TaxID=1250026 RepID=UPI000C707FB5|nr:helix-turn-helix transcriptional regulator [Aquimarina sp. MAR_2010_214]PKV49392.1 DNA-binding XRE family transcriptional regulator [Aquimarina sp. MAR_2010_214]
MSFFGKNIKKIRSVKGLSQQAFAELFDLKRGTLGAYEEGRSEPKIETLIKVANHFSIVIDDLLTNELTVNQLLKFKGDLTTYAEDVKREKFAIIPCITENTAGDYVALYNKEGFVKELPTMQLPVNPTKEFRGYTVSNLEMTSHDKGFYPKDVVVGEKVPATVIKKLNNGTLVFVVVEDKLIFRRLYVAKGNVVLRADHKNIEDSIYPLSEIKELWRVRYVFFRRIPEFGDLVEDKLLMIEQELLKMKDRLSQ